MSNITSDEVERVERSMRGQSQEAAWFKECEKHLQSSKFGRICKVTDRTDKKRLAQSFLTSSPVDAAPLQHARKYEAVAVKQYERLTGKSASACGIFVSPTYPFLGSSPDRLVGDEVLEIKCPYVCGDKDITPTTVPYLQLVGDSLTLDKNHDYYYQVQGQLLCTDKKACQFVVFTFKDMKVIHIVRDEMFISTMVEKLNKFWENHFRPALLEYLFYRRSDQYSFEYV